MDILRETKEVYPYMVDQRRHFHKNPELSLEEFETAAHIRQELDKMGIPNETAAETGVIGEIGREGSIILLRADMDALPLEERSVAPYCSVRPGVMHACGHDAHMAALLGTARILKKYEKELKGTVRLLFQPSEENCLGARKMIESGCLSGASSVFGLHVFTDMPCGSISLEPGPRMAISDNFRIEIHGRTGHAGKPQQCVDATVAGAALVLGLQSVVNRELDPNTQAVVTVGRFYSGSRCNIISGEAVLEGTVRSFHQEESRQIEKAIRRISDFTAQAYRACARVEYQSSMHPEVNNDPDLTETVKKYAEGCLAPEVWMEAPKLFLGEDFSVYQKKLPGVFAFVGAGGENYGYPNHHERFDIDEEALLTCARLYLIYVMAVCGV